MFAAASFLLLAVPREKNNEKTLCQLRKKIADVKTEMGSTHLYCDTEGLKLCIMEFRSQRPANRMIESTVP